VKKVKIKKFSTTPFLSFFLLSTVFRDEKNKIKKIFLQFFYLFLKSSQVKELDWFTQNISIEIEAELNGNYKNILN